MVERHLDGLVAAAVGEGGDPARVLTHAEHDLSAGSGALTPSALAALSRLEADGKLTSTQGKAVLAQLVAEGGDAAEVVRALGLEALSGDELAAAVDAAIAAQPDTWAKYREGNPKVGGAIVGAVMKATRGRADARAVTALLEQRAAAG
ncbi:MAG: hypothetical protein H0U89_08730 [Acidimicrobiia bacterium]|nr:hypothetical protein [Acidimicrobiia bacterium]